MTNELLNLISKKDYANAYDLSMQQTQLPKIYRVFTLIIDGLKYEDIDRSIDFNNFNSEIIETVKLYISLSDSNWNTELLSEFRKVAKMIIAETSSKIRDLSSSHIERQVIHKFDLHINSEIRNYLQQLIEHFNQKELFESKADIARVKSQLTLSMNLEKQFIGADMIQYGRSYENVKQFEDSIQIYYAVVHDFEDALDNLYDDKPMQLLELEYLKHAYEGIDRLSDNAAIKNKLEILNNLVLELKNPSSKQQD